MKPLIWFVLAPAASFIVSGCTSVLAAKTPSSVSAFPLAVELGRVAEGSVSEVRVRLVNRGTSPLQIGKVITSCHCTTSEIGTKVLPVGQPVWLHVKYDAARVTGPQKKLVRVFIAGQPPLDIPLRAEVYPLLKISTPEVDFGGASIDKPTVRTIVMERVDGGFLPTPHFAPFREVEFEAKRSRANCVTLRFTLRPRSFAGARLGVMQIGTGLSALPQMAVPLRADVVGHYRTTPRQMNFGLVRGAAMQRVTISGPDSQALGHLKIAAVPRGFTATLVPTDGKQMLTLRVNGAGSRIVNDAITLKTGLPSETDLRIPVLAVLNPA